RVPGLKLLVHVCLGPCLVPFGLRLAVERRRRLEHRFLEAVRLGDERRPAWVVWKNLAFLINQSLEFFDAEFRDEKLNACPRAILLFTEPRKYAGDRLRDGQQFFLGHEVREYLGLIRHRTETTANVKTKAALAVAHQRKGAQVVHVHKPARFVFATRECDLKLASEILCI